MSDRFKDSRSREAGKQRHVVFDMDETLVHTFEGRGGLADLRLFGGRLTALRPRIYVAADDLWGVTRPISTG